MHTSCEDSLETSRKRIEVLKGELGDVIFRLNCDDEFDEACDALEAAGHLLDRALDALCPTLRGVQ